MLEPVRISCPCCGATIEVLIDPSVREQDYIEDCEVCCQPIRFLVFIDDDGVPAVRALREDDQES